VDIAENSENHLKAIVIERQVAGREGFRGKRRETWLKRHRAKEKRGRSASLLALGGGEC
jgi:hypothetical protein